jgi:hypothetical protein
MKKTTRIYCFLALVLTFSPFAIQAQVPGTLPSGSNQNAGNSPSTSGLNRIYAVTGHYFLSSDGIGSLSTSMSVRVNKPTATAIVVKAILMSTVTNSTIGNGCCTLAGVTINWDGSVTYYSNFFSNYWADVTSIVASAINPLGVGISTLTVTECNSDAQNGEALLVVFQDASLPERTIIILWGGQDPNGANLTLTLASPMDPASPGALMDMGMGIGFSYQGNGTQQYSLINVNGQRLTTASGGEDDGGGADGMLITVGGIGDSNTNPPDPNATPTGPRSDDELYSLLPLITNTTTSVNIFSQNPSNNDNIFLSYFVVSGAAILGEGILLSQATNSGNVGGLHTVQALVLDGSSQPVAGRQVNFSVISGPNNGITGSANTNANGQAVFIYQDNGGPGTDQVRGCYINDQSQTLCSNVLSVTWSVPIPTLSQWGLILLGFALLVAGSVFILNRKKIGITG